MIIVLLGAPGAGKGTQADLISKALSIPILSTGNLLRAAIAAGTELGITAKGYMDEGHLVPDGLIMQLVQDRLARPDCARGVIFDGVPRTVAQAQAMEAFVKVDVALSLEVSDQAIEERMGGRRYCPGCQATYHVHHNPPKAEGVCDRCGAALERRHDDLPEVVESRLAVYHEETEPVKHFYGEKGVLKTVDGEQPLAEATRQVFAALGVSL